MSILRRTAIAIVGSLLITSANAQAVVGLATTSGGATEQIANTLAKVISQKAGVQMRPQILANTSQYLPQVNAGQIEFGIANAPQTYYAYMGTGMSEGQKNPNIRMVAKLFPFVVGLLVTKKSDMRGYADLKGKRVPRYPANSLGDFIIRAALAAGGLTYADVVSVPTANFPRQFDSFKQDKIDTTIATVGSQIVLDFQATLGDVRFLSLKQDDQPKLASLLPGTVIRTVPVEPANVGIEADTLVFAYDYTLFAGKDVSNELVGKVAKVLIDSAADLKESGPLWSEYDPKKIGGDIGIPYHPGAVAAYKAAGIIK